MNGALGSSFPFRELLAIPSPPLHPDDSLASKPPFPPLSSSCSPNFGHKGAWQALNCGAFEANARQYRLAGSQRLGGEGGQKALGLIFRPPPPIRTLDGPFTPRVPPKTQPTWPLPVLLLGMQESLASSYKYSEPAQNSRYSA